MPNPPAEIEREPLPGLERTLASFIEHTLMYSVPDRKLKTMVLEIAKAHEDAVENGDRRLLVLLEKVKTKALAEVNLRHWSLG